MVQGKIVKGIAGFYYVHVAGSGLYECKAKGIFRNQSIKPLVGDDVEITVLDEEAGLGNLTEILPRRNALVRPAVANVDQALVIFAAAKPKPNLNLLDRFLIMMERQQVQTLICFNKKDMVSEEEVQKLREIYEPCGYEILFTSALEEDGIQEIEKHLAGKTTVVAGPSGVGKSSLINLLQPWTQMETGAISEKIERGRHTTRHSELFVVEGGYICDTPGFSSLYITDFEKEELQEYFPEFEEYRECCRFQGCQHVKEPGCMVKEALAKGKISRSRYENYVNLYEELKQRRKY
ncbi:MAG: ribosome small subunit-dependent GTPase A [Lachnospiraceae bacterium]|nr:ribosome small subunit-dependent GTPase A [Lachnospiraceae bacterium]